MSLFYKSKRVGWRGDYFDMYKLRTMVEGADKIGGASTSADDPRITPIGRLLRKFKLDELPQFINVIRGEMAIVGPRPDVPEVVELMSDHEKSVILSVKPGITDLASLWDSEEEEALRGEADPHEAYLRRLWPIKKALQIWYVKNRTWWLDVKIIAATALRMIRIKAIIDVEKMFPELLK